jgi:glycosyltransferase involved in cell wall biosynthesis
MKVDAPQTVSVVIPAYNCARYLPETIESALSQTLPPLEVIVIDDGSTDDTAEVLARFEGRIRHVRQRNLGISAARNAGIRIARGTLIAFLDADDIWLPSMLAQQCEALARTGAGLAHTGFYNWDAATGEKSHPSRDNSLFDGYCYRKFFWNETGDPASAFTVRRACFDTVGLFDEAIPGGCCEDLEMWTRIARRFAFTYIEAPLVLRRQHDSNITRNSERIAEGYFWAKQRALAADPELRRELGEKTVRSRLAQSAFSAGYGYFERGDGRTARRYFLQSLRYGRVRARTLALLGSTYLPQKTRERLRAIVQWRRIRSEATPANSTESE